MFGGRGAPPRVKKAVPSQPFNQFANFNEWAEELGYVPRRKTIEVSRRLADEDLAERLQIESGSLVVATHTHNVIDAVVADEFAAYWLGIKVGDPLLRIRRISYDRHGGVTDCIDNRYLPSKVTFAINNSRDVRAPLRHVVHLDGDEQG